MNGSRPTTRLDADRYWFLMLTSFAVSVIATRIYLEAAGYPQIGSGVLHIAHVLWGGLLQFIALCVFLTYANRWSAAVSAILGGVGVGLFIDEVGKFITQSNDYFFPFAAPIIYASILIVAFAYLDLRRSRPRKPRAYFYWALDQLKEVVDHDLDEDEREQVEQTLTEQLPDLESPEEKQVAQALLNFLQQIPVIPVPQPNFFQRLLNTLQALEERYLSRPMLRLVIAIALGLSSLAGLATFALLFVLVSDPQVLEFSVRSLFDEGFLRSPIGFPWLVFHSTLTGANGVLYLIATILLITRWEPRGIELGRLALILELTIVNLLAFYFSQFAMIVPTLTAVAILFAVERYRARFLTKQISGTKKKVLGKKSL